MNDIALEMNVGTADLVIENDDIASEKGLSTAVILSLFTDRRAEPDDFLPGDDDDRRGWWADELLAPDGDPIGSRLWLLDRSVELAEVALRAEEYAREALAWMLPDRVAGRIDVSVETANNELALVVTIERPGEDPVSFRFARVWDQETARAL